MSVSHHRKLPTLVPALSAGSWWLLGLAYLTMVLLWLGGDSTRLALRYQRAAVFDGQWWRLLTGHLVHFDLRHLLLNLAGATVMLLLFAPAMTRRQLLSVLTVSMMTIDTGFIWLMPRLDWYVGLSGILHGVLAAGALLWWRVETWPMAGALSAIVVGKLTWEQVHGGLPLAGELPVVVNAHLYGAIGGALCGVWFLWRSRHNSASAATPL